MTGNETSNEILRRKFTGEIYCVRFIYDAEHSGPWGGVRTGQINPDHITYMALSPLSRPRPLQHSVPTEPTSHQHPSALLRPHHLIPVLPASPGPGSLPSSGKTATSFLGRLCLKAGPRERRGQQLDSRSPRGGQSRGWHLMNRTRE